MPNWVCNILSTNDEMGRKFILDHCVDENGYFTFDKLIPMPEILKHTQFPIEVCTSFHIFIERYGNKVDYTFSDAGMLYADSHTVMTKECSNFLREKYGADNWYEWKLKNWGCKWDAKTCEKIDREQDFSFHFETPWGQPDEFIQKFTLQTYKECPESTFTWWWEEEQGYGQELIITKGNATVNKDWDMPEYDEHEFGILLISGNERRIAVTKISGGDPDRYGEDVWYAEENGFDCHETLLEALGNAVPEGEQVVRIGEIDELIECVCRQRTEHLFLGVENRFSVELRDLIQKKVA